MNTIETELKFQVPPATRERLRAALDGPGAAIVALQARYADTADLRLAAAGLALRLRREDVRWVQTLKGRGDGLMARPEDEVVLPSSRRPPAIDPSRHAGSEVGDRLMALLADGAPLVERYRTEVTRTRRHVRSGGATIEVAFDEGRIVAGRRRLPVCEVEFELIAGPGAALFAFAARWATRHGLWLDVRTKAERGHRLASGFDAVPAQKAEPVHWAGSPGPGEVFAATLRNTLAQLLPNAAEIAGGSAAAEPLHQLRVAMRRLRTALRLIGDWCADPPAARALEARWREPFGRLGVARDADVLAALPGLPLPALPTSPAAEDPGAIVREGAFSVLALDTMALAAGALPALEAPTIDVARAVIARAWRQVAAGAARFAGAEHAEQHRTRRRLKRLRYATEFLRPLLPATPTTRALAAMRMALDALGEYNDVLVAEARCRTLDTFDPKVAFALGWLAARREMLQTRAARRLERLQGHRRFWR